MFNVHLFTERMWLFSVYVFLGSRKGVKGMKRRQEEGRKEREGEGENQKGKMGKERK